MSRLDQLARRVIFQPELAASRERFLKIRNFLRYLAAFGWHKNRSEKKSNYAPGIQFMAYAHF
jgi:hypothetical protein